MACRGPAVLQRSNGPTPSAKSWKMAPAASPAASNGKSFVSLYGGNRKDFDQPDTRWKTYLLFPPTAPVNTKDLVEAGLYFTGVNDETRCFSCNVAISNWQEGDKPIDVHQKRSPECQFLKSPRVAKLIGQSHASNEVLSPDCIDGYDCSSIESQSKYMANEDVVDGHSLTSDLIRLKQENSEHFLQSSDSKTSANKTDTNTIRNEIERMRLTFTCRQCKSEKVQTLFLPCRHLVSCEACAETMDDCLLCKQKILGTVRVYLV